MSNELKKKYNLLVKRGVKYSERRVEIDKEYLKYYSNGIYTY
jgi:hypothetical protein